jgi:hypothetical protein
MCRRRASPARAVRHDRIADVGVLRRRYVRPARVAESEEAGDVPVASRSLEVLVNEAPDVFGQRDPEFRGPPAGSPVLGRFQVDLSPLHHDGGIIAAKGLMDHDAIRMLRAIAAGFDRHVGFGQIAPPGASVGRKGISTWRRCSAIGPDRHLAWLIVAIDKLRRSRASRPPPERIA